MKKTLREIDSDGNLQCSMCGEKKPIAEFPKDSHSRLGYSYQCKVCKRTTVAASYRKNQTSRLAAAKQYRDANRGKLRAYGHRYYARNKERFREKYNPMVQRANKAVQTAVRQGKLPPQSTQYCVQCQRPAQQYHHQSYLISDRLCVVPVCLSCHHGMNRGRHEGNDNLGVFPTRFGLVRISVASTN